MTHAAAAQLQNIFEVHKTEILDLLQVLAHLADTFGNVYMAIAPPLVNVINTVVLPVLNDVAKVIDAIAHSSNVAAFAIGALIISMRTFGAGATLGALGKIVGIGGGAAAAGGGVAAGTTSLAAKSSISDLLATGGEATGIAAIAAAASAAIPIILGGAAAAVIIITFSTPETQAKFRSASTGQEVVNPRVAAFLTPQEKAAIGGPLGGAHLPSLITPQNVAGVAAIPGGALAGQTVNIKKIGDFSNYSAAQLKDLPEEVLNEWSTASRVSGVGEVISQVRALGAGALTTKTILNNALNSVATITKERFEQTGQSLSKLTDDFTSNTKLIAHVLGLNSAEGAQAMQSNIKMMVASVTQGMLSGKISVTAGMKAISNALTQGMNANAITWNTKWNDMFNAVTTLYAAGKISLKTYLSDSANVMQNGMRNIQQTQQKGLNTQLADLKQQQNDGIITQQQYNSRAHALREANNASTSEDMVAWVAHVESAMQSAGALTGKGMQLITTEVNKAFGLFWCE